MADKTPTPASVLAASGATLREGTAGVTITAGDLLYADADDSGSLKLADADALATANCVGIAVNGGADGQPIKYCTAGNINPGFATVVGTIYYVSTTAGLWADISSDLTSGDFVTIIGVGTATNNVAVKINVSGAAIA
jgi:hypothetical protein